MKHQATPASCWQTGNHNSPLLGQLLASVNQTKSPHPVTRLLCNNQGLAQLSIHDDISAGRPVTTQRQASITHDKGSDELGCVYLGMFFF